AIVINGIVYYGAARTIYCYDPLQDKWTTPLPSPPVTYFGLGQIDGKLVTIGGDNKLQMRCTLTKKASKHENGSR
ncbi:MAG: kelch repeat-containing protein, partial [Proteobacteria bacterium]|nr:kelch repeat-containing protein [Pseudomonadota bacterium]